MAFTAISWFPPFLMTLLTTSAMTMFGVMIVFFPPSIIFDAFAPLGVASRYSIHALESIKNLFPDVKPILLRERAHALQRPQKTFFRLFYGEFNCFVRHQVKFVNRPFRDSGHHRTADFLHFDQNSFHQTASVKIILEVIFKGLWT